MRRSRVSLALLATGLLCGCGGIYSKQEFGPVNPAGTTLTEVIQQNGAPDIIGGNDKFLIIGYTRTEGKQTLGVYATAKRTTTAFLINETGKVVGQGTVPAGEAMTVFAPDFHPISLRKTN